MTVACETDRVIIGIGNSFRGDDAVGLLVARRLKLLKPEGFRVEECDGEGTRLLELWENSQLAVVIDTICSGRPPGTFQYFEATHRPLPARFFKSTSSHSLGLAEAIELGRVLNRLPARLVIYGIEGRQFELGSPPLPEVKQAVGPVLRRLKADLMKFSHI